MAEVSLALRRKTSIPKRNHISYDQRGHDNHQYNAKNILITQSEEAEFEKIASWLSRADPWTNHTAARQQHTPETGTWLLNSERYKRWKAGSLQKLWIHGKLGCGKTVLCSTVIEDIQEHLKDSDQDLAIFYFTFSEEHKQSYEDLLRSLLAQLGRREPTLSRLRRFRKANRRTFSVDELETMLCSVVRAQLGVHVILDALDECPEENDTRQTVLEGLERLVQRTSKLKLLVTSRRIEHIRETLESQEFEQMSVSESAVDEDVRRYLSAKLSKDARLHSLKKDMKDLIEMEIAKKSQGMFRYAALQLREIARLKLHRPSDVQKVLESLPSSLDETYDRMLAKINTDIRPEAITLLRWLTYAQMPLSLGELAETVIIDGEKGSVNIRDRGDVKDTLRVLEDLVVVVCSNEDDSNADDWRRSDEESEAESDMSVVTDEIHSSSEIRLAHFSVKEYLMSDRMNTSVKAFHLDPVMSHFLLSRNCLTYLNHYDGSCERTSTPKDLETFPLLFCAAIAWYHHALQHQHIDVSAETSFLQSDIRHWLMVHNPDYSRERPFTRQNASNMGKGLYYAAYIGLIAVVKLLVRRGVKVNAKGGYYGNALQAASARGHVDIVQMLVERDADVNARGGRYGSAIQAATARSHWNIVKLLVESGADCDAGIDNVYGGTRDNALYAASGEGHLELVKLLLDKGAEVNVGKRYNALYAASDAGHLEIVELLIQRGAKINTRIRRSALCAASGAGHLEIVRLLLDKGAEINVGKCYNALYAASDAGHLEIVELLIQRGAKINTGIRHSALCAASGAGHLEIVKLLVEKGAKINTGIRYNALYAASGSGHLEIVKLLVNRGAVINEGRYDAIHAASRHRRRNVVDFLEREYLE